jgi:cytochrome oxidase Cu insertion factor (SCO1/SenC/PrrC family)
MFYARREVSDAADYLVDHTASLMLIGEDGHLKLVYPFGTPGEDLADDLDYLIR